MERKIRIRTVVRPKSPNHISWKSFEILQKSKKKAALALLFSNKAWVRRFKSDSTEKEEEKNRGTFYPCWTCILQTCGQFESLRKQKYFRIFNPKLSCHFDTHLRQKCVVWNGMFTRFIPVWYVENSAFKFWAEAPLLTGGSFFVPTCSTCI
jgi:hypothetical protein